MSPIGSLMPALAQAHGVGLDPRGYPNGTHEILSHLTSEPLPSAIWRVPWIARPDRAGLADWDASDRGSL